MNTASTLVPLSNLKQGFPPHRFGWRESAYRPALFATGTNINIQSLMGSLMLIGVVNNSILLVEFANKQMDRGHSPFEAAYEAACVRLRPILMTSLTMVASMAPFAFNISIGNEAMVPLARAMIGGMVASTILTLFLVPCVYTLAKKHQPKNA